VKMLDWICRFLLFFFFVPLLLFAGKPFRLALAKQMSPSWRAHTHKKKNKQKQKTKNPGIFVGLGCGLSNFHCFYRTLGHYPGHAVSFEPRLVSETLRMFPQFESVASPAFFFLFCCWLD
jgi:hypothetical protein